MEAVSKRELDREFRVLDQTLSMHSMLRDRYTRWALAVDIVLLACAIVFCATSFARDDAFEHIGFSTNGIRYVLGLTSIGALFAAMVSILVDWKGRAARHEQAVERFTPVVGTFRKYRREDGSWVPGQEESLHREYWEATRNVAEVPAAKFVGLKARHLRKVEISRMLDASPGVPVLIVRTIVLWRSLKGIKRGRRNAEVQHGGEPHEDL